MIQNYLNDSLMQNYLAPNYPIFIQIKFLLNSMGAKKSVRNAKNDILHVPIDLCSLPERSAPRESASYLPT